MSASQNWDESDEPKSVYDHPIQFAQYMRRMMGLIQSYKGHDHFFVAGQNSVNLYEEIIEAERQGELVRMIGQGEKEKLKSTLDRDALQKLHQIWSKTAWLVVKYNPKSPERVSERYITYEKPEEKQLQEIIDLPQLQNLNPLNSPKDEDTFIRIRQKVPAKYAFQGLDYETVTIQGKYFTKFVDKTEPKFRNPSELKSKNILVAYVGRFYWEQTLGIMKKEFNRWNNVLFINVHRIIKEMLTGNTNLESRAYRSEIE